MTVASGEWLVTRENPADYWRLTTGYCARRSCGRALSSVGGVFFVFVAVVVIVVAGGAAGRQAVQDETRHLGAGFAQEHEGAIHRFAGGLAGADDEDGLMNVRGDVEGVAHGVDGRAVEDDALESVAELRDEGRDVGGADQLSGVGGAVAG